VLYFSEEENDVVIISMRKSVQGLCCSRSIFSAHSATKFSTTFFVLKEVGSLLWEVRELAMLITTPGIDSICFIASRLQDKCSWCSEMVVVQHNAAD
jgi:hypothetical protein